MYTHKRTVCVTLDIECYDDLYLEDLDWKSLLDLEGDENVQVSIKEPAEVYQCASSQIVRYEFVSSLRSLISIRIIVTVGRVSTKPAQGTETVYCIQVVRDCPMNRYMIEVDRIEPNGEIFTLVEYRNLKATKSTIGRDRQLNNLTNRIGEELRYYQVPHKRYTVSVA